MQSLLTGFFSPVFQMHDKVSTRIILNLEQIGEIVLGLCLFFFQRHNELQLRLALSILWKKREANAEDAAASLSFERGQGWGRAKRAVRLLTQEASLRRLLRVLVLPDLLVHGREHPADVRELLAEARDHVLTHHLREFDSPTSFFISSMKRSQLFEDVSRKT